MSLRGGVCIAGIAAIVVAATGCGGGDSGQAASGSPLGKAAFVKKANALCEASYKKRLAAAQKAFREALKTSDKPRKELEYSIVRTIVAPRLQAQLDDLRALGAPRGDKKQVDAILDAVQELIDRVRVEPRAFFEAVLHFKHPDARAHRLAGEYGIKECSEV
jgi:hypothetical protein